MMMQIAVSVKIGGVGDDSDEEEDDKEEDDDDDDDDDGSMDGCNVDGECR